MQQEIKTLENEVFRLLYMTYFSRYDDCAKKCNELNARLYQYSLLHKIYYPTWYPGWFSQLDESNLILTGMNYILKKHKLIWRKLAVDMSVFDSQVNKFEHTLKYAIVDTVTRSDYDMINTNDIFYKSMTVNEYNENYTIHKNVIRFLELYLLGWVIKWYRLFLPYKLLIVVEWDVNYQPNINDRLISMYIYRTREKLELVTELDDKNEYKASYKVDFDVLLDIKRK